MSGNPGNLQGRMDRLEEAVAMDNGGLLQGRVKRLEEATADIQHAQAQMEQSLRVLSLASLTIKRAMADVLADVSDLALIPRP